MSLKPGGARGGLRNVSVGAAPDDAIPDSAVSRWTFDDADTDSGTATDVWNGNDGTINGATTGVSGKYNEAYDFDGTDDYVDTFALSTSLTQNPHTHSVWINTTSTNINHIYGLNDSNTDDFAYHRINVGGTTDEHKFRYSIYGGDDLQATYTSSDLTDGTWRMLTAVVEPGTPDITVYIDDSAVTFDSSRLQDVTNIDLSNTSMYIGAQNKAGSSDSEFAGSIDDPRIYDKALSSAEVSDLYNTGSI